VLLYAAGLFLALALRRPELAALAAPFGLLALVGLARARRPELDVALRLERERVFEGDAVGAELVVRAWSDEAAVAVALALPAGFSAEPSLSRLVIARLAAGEERRLALELRCGHWGVHRLGPLELRPLDAAGMVTHRIVVPVEARLRVYPRPERLRAVVEPRETQPHAGNRVSRRAGEGIEFADVRAFAPGDRLRSINWRASSRRNELVVNDRHPEQQSDVVLFLDTFGDVSGGDPAGTLDLAVGAAASLAAAYLERRDRVGVVGFGGMVQWLLPSAGTGQLYRIVEALLQTEVVLSYAWKDVDVVPARTLPAHALVVALSPLLDDRTVEALADLRRRGFDLVIVELSPLPFVRQPEGSAGELAWRFWRLQREALRFRYERLGVAVVRWEPGRDLPDLLEEVRTFRRHAAQARL
jgi:uncharacterized protein (DUF58 family)